MNEIGDVILRAESRSEAHRAAGRAEIAVSRAASASEFRMIAGPHRRRRRRSPTLTDDLVRQHLTV